MAYKILTNFAYFGSKSKLFTKLSEFIDDGSNNCNTFIDGFGGSGVVTLNIDADLFDRRIINDLNPRLFLIHKALSEPKIAYEVINLIERTELSKDCYNKAQRIWKQYESKIKNIFEPEMLSTTDAGAFETQINMWKKYIPEERITELAVAALVIFKQSFNGLGKSPKPEFTGNEDIQYYNWIDNTLDKVSDKMEGVEVYCVNTLVLINKYKNDSNVFMYLDSPYELKTRNNRKAYEIDMDDKDQNRYIDTIIDSKAPILLSGYKHNGKSIYDRLIQSGKWGCEILAEDVPKYSDKSDHGDIKPREDEWVWFNY